MAQDDEEKMRFYIDYGTYCYIKMSFGLKNVGATYQRLVDTAFQSLIGRNLEAYVDDMVIKSNDEKVLIVDIAETFDNLWRIIIKLNMKKNAHLGYVIPSDLKGDAESEWKAGRVKEVLIQVGRKIPTIFQNLEGHNERKQGRVPMDRKCEKSILGNEEGYSRATIIDHPQHGRNVVCVSGSGRGRREFGIDNGKEGEMLALKYVDKRCRKESLSTLYSIKSIRSTTPLEIIHIDICV
ncbi:hypothetical protein Tco_0901800 [Tanacetum coccineum]